MISLPANTLLGELAMLETFNFFDIPRLFSCQNRAGATYLCLSTFDDGENFEWLYLPISQDRYSSLLDNQIDLLSCFIQPEDGYLFKVKSNFEGDATVQHLLPEQIAGEDLPEPGVLLDTDLESRPGPGTIDAKEAAIRSKRETYNIHLYPWDTQLAELDIDHLGSVLTSFQDLVYAIGQSCDGEPTLKGAIPAHIIEATKLRATQMFDGSFGLQIKSKSKVDLFDKSLASDALLELTNLLQVLDDEDALSNKLHHLEGRVASKYRTFVKQLKRVGSPLKIDWGSPNPERGRSLRIERNVIDSIYRIVSKIDIDMSESVRFHAELLGLDVATKRYRVRHLDDNEVYSGKISEEAFNQVEHSEINAIYVVTLKQIIETNSLSGSENIKWLLLGLSPAESSSNK